jgi:pSer/pThr/pTyr-binding forkhead associated (FHA) protein
MIICPSCRHEEYDGEFFCSECGARIWGASEQPPPTMKFESGRLRDTSQPLMDPIAPDKLATGQIVLTVAGAPRPITLEGRTEYRLGREAADQQPVEVNLNPFGAREKGVSRVHATLRVDRQQVLLMDLGSSNGTQLNGTALAPNEPARLESGDEIRLGKLAIKIHFNL